VHEQGSGAAGGQTGTDVNDPSSLDGTADPLIPWGLGHVPAAQRKAAGKRIGRVTSVHRGECDAVTAQGTRRVLSDARRSQGCLAPVTGDWVEIDEPPDAGATGAAPVIARVLPRRTRLSRRDPAERDTQQVLAANMEFTAVVHGLDRPLRPGHLERLLVLAIDSAAEPVVVLTKSDIAADAEVEAAARSLAPGMSVVVTSAVDGSGLDALRSLIPPGATMALIGASGVGKSSLVNALACAEIQAVGEVRGSDARGRHTTDARRLVLLPSTGGLLIDTPGIRAVGLWEAEQALDLVFADLAGLAHGCRFRDCSHQGEAGCALAAAVASGSVDRRRVEHFVALGVELGDQRERLSERTRRSPGR